MIHSDRTIRLYNLALEQVQNFIVERYEKDITLDTFIAEHPGWSRRHVQRALNHHGLGWRDLLRRTRISVAKELLVVSNLTIGQISKEVGYRQASQFAKTFKQETGVSPSEYRDRN